MSTYYVAAPAHGGSDSNNGTSLATPWATITHVNAQSFSPGDTINFNGGDTFSGGIAISSGGSAGNPITFQSYGTGQATISSGSAVNGCYIHNFGYIVVQNLIFTGPASASALTGHGIYCLVDQSNTTYNFIRINNVTVTGYSTGIYVYGTATWHTSPQNGWNDVRITNSIVHDNSNNGINISDNTANGNYSNVYIGYCTVYNHPGVTGQTNWSGSGIQVGVTTNGTVEYCTAYNNGTNLSAHSGAVGIWCASANNVIIQYCESYNNTSSAGDGDGFDIDGESQNCIIQYCYSHGNKGPGFLFAQYTGANAWANNIIRFNISENDGGGIGLYGETATYLITNGQIYNNTVYSSVSCVLLYEAGDDGSFHGSGLTIKNNIFITSSQPFTVTGGGTSGSTLSNNDYYALVGSPQWQWFGTNYGTLASWGQDPHGSVLNPLLVNPGHGGTNGIPVSSLTAYRLQSGSPMVGLGAPITGAGAHDFFGNPLAGQAPTIGAQVSGASVSRVPIWRGAGVA